MNALIQKHLPCIQLSPPSLFLCGFVALFSGCATQATFEGMVPTSLQTAKRHPQTVRVDVTGGQETVAIGEAASHERRVYSGTDRSDPKIPNVFESR